MSIEYIVVTHRESREIIYYKTAGDFDPNLLDMFRSSVQYEILDLPLGEGGIEHATLEGKYLITRAGKFIWISLILKHRPIIYSREVIKFFCKLFENQYEREICDLYTHYDGDISIFKQDPYSRQSLDKIIEDLFHLYLTLPFKIGSIRGKEISAKSKKIIQLAKPLAQKAKGNFLLEKLFNEASKVFKLENEKIADLIYDLVEQEVFLPISEEKTKKKIPIHF